MSAATERSPVLRESSVSPTSTARLGSLDGLRGVAAVVVVFSHVFDLSQNYLLAGSGPSPERGLTLYSAWVTQPGALLVAGSQAVYVFFVLSGLVLTLSVVRKPRFDWIAYYPSRLIRLYLPAAASILLAALLILLVARVPNGEPGEGWIQQSAVGINPGQILDEMTLTSIAPQYNVVLWSLYLEVAFSVLLPMFVAFALLTRRWWWVAGLAALALCAIGTETGNLGFSLLPIFFVGTILAVRLGTVQRAIDRVNASRLPGALWLPGLLVALLLFIPGVVVPPLRTMEHGQTIIQVAWVLGAVLLVVVALGWKPLASALRGRVLSWFGQISFSLYLVHVPILTTLTFLWGGAHWKLIGAVGIPLSIGAAWLFHVAVERTSHRLARRVGARIHARGDRPATV